MNREYDPSHDDDDHAGSHYRRESPLDPALRPRHRLDDELPHRLILWLVGGVIALAGVIIVVAIFVGNDDDDDDDDDSLGRPVAALVVDAGGDRA